MAAWRRPHIYCSGSQLRTIRPGGRMFRSDRCCPILLRFGLTVRVKERFPVGRMASPQPGPFLSSDPGVSRLRATPAANEKVDSVSPLEPFTRCRVSNPALRPAILDCAFLVG